MTEDTQIHQQEDLGGRVASSAGWVLVSQIPTQILGLVTSIVIARLLGPFDVGLAVEAIVFASLALMFADFGFAAVIIQRPTLTEADRSTAFWTGATLGALLTLIGVGLSWPIAALYDQPEVQPLFAVLSITFLLSSLGIVQSGLLVRDLEFRSLELRTIAATAASCAAGIAVAVAGGGPWAIIVQHIVIVGVSTALLWRASPWRPKFTFSRQSLREMAGYSSHILGIDVLGWAMVSMDNFLIGRYLGPRPLGTYSIAYSVMTTPIRRIASPLANVFFPTFSAMKDPNRIGEVWLRATGMVAVVVVPLTLGMIPVAPDLVDGFFGEEWESAAVLVQILAAASLIQSLSSLSESVLQALAHTRILFRWTLVLTVLSVVAFAAALPLGVEGVAWAFLAVTLLLHPILVRLTARLVGVTFGDWLRSIAGPLQAGALMLIPVSLAGEALPDSTAHLLRLGVMTAVGAVSYGLLLRWRFPQAFEEIRRVRARRRTARTASPEASS